jgi:hypothetical protein
MVDDNNNDSDIKDRAQIRIKNIIDSFKNKIDVKLTDTSNPISISNIEKYIGEAKNEVVALILNEIQDIVKVTSETLEKEPISKKKENTKKKK